MGFSRFKSFCAAGLLAGAALGAATDAAAESANTPPPPLVLPAPDDTPHFHASIPFADHGGIYDWRANGNVGLWVQALNRQWYYATFMGTCWGLDTAPSIGFVTDVTGEFDRWSSVIVPHQPRCHLSTFEQSAAPPQLRSASRLG